MLKRAVHPHLMESFLCLRELTDCCNCPRRGHVYSNLKRKVSGRPMFDGLLDSLMLWWLRCEFHRMVACIAVTKASASTRVFPGIVKQWGLVGKEGAVPSRRRTILSELTGSILH